jgi:hypothetical protein
MRIIRGVPTWCAWREEPEKPEPVIAAKAADEPPPEKVWDVEELYEQTEWTKVTPLNKLTGKVDEMAAQGKFDLDMQQAIRSSLKQQGRPDFGADVSSEEEAFLAWKAGVTPESKM